MTARYRRPDVHQEEDDLPWVRILLVALAVLGIMAILILWADSLLRASEAELRPSGEFPERDLGPRHEVSGVQQRLFIEGKTGEIGRGQALTQRKRLELSRFAWTDRDRGLIQIPIEDAMELVVEESGR